MLYLPVEATKPKRLQGCFVSFQEIERLVNFWDAQRQPQTVKPPPYIVGEGATYDPLLEEARRLAKEHKTVSASHLARRLHIGYSRATQLMELLEKENPKEH
jgi:S-DNA-T family DNA segregation ATPase FtsK/SpoIIIE